MPPGTAAVRAGRRPAHRGLVARLALLAVACAVAAVAGELAVRFLAPRVVPGNGRFYVEDDELQYRLRPGFSGRFSDGAEFDTAVRVNAEGLRGPELDAGAPGLLGLGDSILFGYGVEEEVTFVAGAAHALGLVELNAGAPAYDVSRAARLGQRLLPRLHPRAVVLSVFLGNDEVDSAPGRLDVRVVDGALVAVGTERSPLRRATHAVYLRSHLLRLVAERAGSGHALLPILEPYRLPPGADLLAGDVVIEASVRALAQACRGAGVPLLVVVIPEKLEVVDGELERIAAGAGVASDRFDREGPRRRVLAALARAEASALDLRPALAAATARGEAVYLRRDRHLSPAGHAIVAKGIVNAMVIRGESCVLTAVPR